MFCCVPAVLAEYLLYLLHVVPVLLLDLLQGLVRDDLGFLNRKFYLRSNDLNLFCLHSITILRKTFHLLIFYSSVTPLMLLQLTVPGAVSCTRPWPAGSCPSTRRRTPFRTSFRLWRTCCTAGHPGCSSSRPTGITP